MEEFALLEKLGNAGVIPIVIFLTQAIKKRIGNFKYGSDVLALILSFVLCIGWEFYYMSPEAYEIWVNLNGLGFFQWGISMAMTGVGTWFMAGKIYDFGHGNRKREKKIVEEKKVLEEEIVVLQNGNGDNNGKTVEETDLSSRLREILEKGS